MSQTNGARPKPLQQVEGATGVESLLEAITASVTHILKADQIKSALPRAMEQIICAANIDRMVIIEETRARGDTSRPPIIYFVWQTPIGAKAGNPGEIIAKSPDREAIAHWLSPLRDGDHVVALGRTAQGAIKTLLSDLKVASVLVVPIMVNGEYWGSIGFDDCRSEHEWSRPEINALKVFAELVGTAITRERFLDELTKANTIVQNSPTVLYRLHGTPPFAMDYASRNIQQFGYSLSDLMGQSFAEHAMFATDDQEALSTALADLFLGAKQSVISEHRLTSASGDVRWIENRLLAVRHSSGHMVEIEGTLVDITERKAAEERIAKLARTDPLTGLANRATFNERLHQFYHANQRGNHAFAVLYLDLDRFKEVNDTKGHHIGDRLLQEVAERLTAISRQGDVVARLGGDEFAILQSDLTDLADIQVFASKIVNALTAAYVIEGHELHIGTSVGIAMSSVTCEHPSVLLSQADLALYQAKQNGRGQYRLFSDQLDAETREQSQIAEDLRTSIEAQLLSFGFQPQANYRDGQITNRRVVASWRHPQRGQVTDRTLRQLADKAGLARALFLSTLDVACNQLTIWRAAGQAEPFISVPVDHAIIKLGVAFLEDIQSCLARHGLQPEDLELDVTEMTLAKITISGSQVLQQLRQLGVHIAIDDFGGPLSSIDYIQSYGVRRLKISKSIACGPTSIASAPLVQGILSLATELGVTVLATSGEPKVQPLAS